MKDLAKSLKGLKNQGAAKIRAGEASGDVGKRMLPLPDYRRLALTSLKLGPGGKVDGEEIQGLKDIRHITSLHMFVLFAWNLCMRCDSVTAIHTKHIDWNNDSLAIGVNKSKMHNDEDYEWFKVYANPFDPAVCPVLSLAIHLVCEPQVTAQSGPIFPMSDPQATLNRALAALFLFLALVLLGSHSLRKVVFVVAPPFVPTVCRSSLAYLKSTFVQQQLVLCCRVLWVMVLLARRIVVRFWL